MNLVRLNLLKSRKVIDRCNSVFVPPPPPPPPRKRAPAHKFASEFVHHPRKCAPWCSFSRGTYQRIRSPRVIVHQAEAELEPAAPNTCLLCRSSCTTKARAEVTVFRCKLTCSPATFEGTGCRVQGVGRVWLQTLNSC